MDQKTAEEFEKIGYRLVGKNKHSAVKVCTWAKHSMSDKKRIGGYENYCYKQKFYGIKSHRCVQMSPAVPFCTERCEFCWRPRSVTAPKWINGVDEPAEILDGCIAQQVELLQGFRSIADSKKMHEAENPRHVAISLDGEPLLYPKINGLIEEIARRKMTSFLVSNGTVPEALQQLVEPTQLYITLAAPDKDVFEKTCRPLISNVWEKLNESLLLLNNFSCNTVIRLTLVRDLNMVHAEKYAKIIEKSNPKYVEVKAFMSIGHARERLPYSAMPRHDEIKEFAQRIADESGYKVRDEKVDSRVVLLER
ncbi:MAG: 4-demethylwyosine synthase TYW1 [Candidatus Aenigmarchaeota archaeon]|nr:4-demethylwyosine synthase TYW1 [Candidatus Aenigmarchaeota archaeon]